jgi:hypothetical protein
MEMVHRFYDEYYFRPKQVYRIVRKAIFNNVDRKRLYKEAKSFLKLRSARNKYVQDSRKNPQPPAEPVKQVQEEAVEVGSE